MNLLNLPDELLLCIFGKLSRPEVLYSLMDVHQRLDRILLHPSYLRALDFSMLWSESQSTQQHHFDNRISQRIIPRIHQQVHELILNDIALQQVLHTFEFPQLRSLSLQLDRCETFVKCLKGTLCHLATQQQQWQLSSGHCILCSHPPGRSFRLPKP